MKGESYGGKSDDERRKCWRNETKEEQRRAAPRAMKRQSEKQNGRRVGYDCVYFSTSDNRTRLISLSLTGLVAARAGGGGCGVLLHGQRCRRRCGDQCRVAQQHVGLSYRREASLAYPSDQTRRQGKAQARSSDNRIICRGVERPSIRASRIAHPRRPSFRRRRHGVIALVRSGLWRHDRHRRHGRLGLLSRSGSTCPTDSNIGFWLPWLAQLDDFCIPGMRWRAWRRGRHSIRHSEAGNVHDGVLVCSACLQSTHTAGQTASCCPHVGVAFRYLAHVTAPRGDEAEGSRCAYRNPPVLEGNWWPKLSIRAAPVFIAFIAYRQPLMRMSVTTN